MLFSSLKFVNLLVQIYPLKSQSWHHTRLNLEYITNQPYVKFYTTNEKDENDDHVHVVLLR